MQSWREVSPASLSQVLAGHALSVGVRGWQETSRLPEIQAQITAVTARALVNVRGMLAWAEHVRTDNAELLRLEQEMQDLEAVQATRDASFNDWTGGHPCIHWSESHSLVTENRAVTRLKKNAMCIHQKNSDTP